MRNDGVYELVPILFAPSQKVVCSQRVNNNKVDSPFESRLALQGWYQGPGFDYGGTLAAVCRL